MTTWFVDVEFGGAETTLSEDVADELVDALSANAGVISISPAGYSVRVAVDADTPRDAVDTALSVVGDAVMAAIGTMHSVVRVEATTETRLDAELNEPPIPPLVGVAELAARLGVSRQRVSELRRTMHFPAPLADLRSGPVWAEPTLERFIATWPRRPGRKASNGRTR